MEDTVREIAALARELAVETEHGRLPDALLEKLRSSGLMNAGAPGDAGGLELPPWAGRGLFDDRRGGSAFASAV
jgi:alkylation response protein AidB-like acyl-CoA dehydrogenase